ncbi:glycosyltransferase [Streptomyces sp. ODS28]|uniref:glycosyltransferase n=1 Tax=Streptomyces sp. ODS28 TaxID=3136688 RepID=UPI0031E8135A
MTAVGTAAAGTPGAGETDEVDLTFALPMYNEEGIVHEAVTRVLKAGAESGRSYEVLAVDDGSSDRTPELLAGLQDTHDRFRWVQLRPNCGQPASSKAALLAARGRMVAVLDADLQTPPELVPRLADALESAGPYTAAVFGTTSTRRRKDPVRLLAGQAVFYFVQTRLSRNPIPHGASSFFVMRRDAAHRVARLRFTKGNVGSVLAALGLGIEAVTYDKPASYRADSRLGLRGHVEEAVGSLALTGVLSRCGGTAAALGAAAAAASRLRGRSRARTAAYLAGAGMGLVAAGAAESFLRTSLTDSDTELPIFAGTSGDPA